MRRDKRSKAAHRPQLLNRCRRLGGLGLAVGETVILTTPPVYPY